MKRLTLWIMAMTISGISAQALTMQAEEPAIPRNERVEQQVEQILSRLTLDEKIKLVTGYGSWHTYPVERLGVESIMMTDGPIGLRKVDEGESESHVSVCFPSGCLTSCSFDKELLEKMGEVLGEECQAYEVGMILGPAINIKRSPLCGRNFEYYFEVF